MSERNGELNGEPNKMLEEPKIPEDFNIGQVKRDHPSNKASQPQKPPGDLVPLPKIPPKK